MLNLFRRHTKTCPHDSRDALRCQCPIWFDWTTDRQRIRKPLGLRDWQAAQRRAREMEADGITTTNGTITVQAATEDFLKHAQNDIQGPTIKLYRLVFDRLNDYCRQNGYVFLKQIGVMQIREFRASWTYSPRTAYQHIARLKRFFSWCVENEWLTKSPAQPLKPPTVGDTDVVPFSEEQVQKILQACEQYGVTDDNPKGNPNRIRLIILTDIMLATGLAIGDASMLTKHQVTHRRYWRVELRRAKTGVPVSCPIPEALANRFHALDGEHPFWTGKSDRDHLTKNWRKIYARVFKAAGVDGHPHQFRHTFAKRLLVNSVAVGHVASLLGNTELICRKNYAKWIPERQEALDKAVVATWVGHTDGTQSKRYSKYPHKH